MKHLDLLEYIAGSFTHDDGRVYSALVQAEHDLHQRTVIASGYQRASHSLSNDEVVRRCRLFLSSEPEIARGISMFHPYLVHIPDMGPGDAAADQVLKLNAVIMLKSQIDQYPDIFRAEYGEH